MSNNLPRCPGFCIKIVKVKENNKEITKRIAGVLTEVEQEKQTGRLFCTTNGCPFYYRDEHGRDIWKEGADLLSIPTEDPLKEVNI